VQATFTRNETEELFRYETDEEEDPEEQAQQAEQAGAPAEPAAPLPLPVSSVPLPAGGSPPPPGAANSPPPAQLPEVDSLMARAPSPVLMAPAEPVTNVLLEDPSACGTDAVLRGLLEDFCLNTQDNTQRWLKGYHVYGNLFLEDLEQVMGGGFGRALPSATLA
jgi:hypothetical protein